MWGGRGGKARTGKGKRNELGRPLQLEAGTCGREQRAVARERPHGGKARSYVQLKLEVTVDHVCVQKGHGSGPCPKTQLRLTVGDRDSSLPLHGATWRTKITCTPRVVAVAVTKKLLTQMKDLNNLLNH